MGLCLLFWIKKLFFAWELAACSHVSFFLSHLQDPLLLFIYGESEASDTWGNTRKMLSHWTVDAMTLNCSCVPPTKHFFECGNLHKGKCMLAAVLLLLPFSMTPFIKHSWLLYQRIHRLATSDVPDHWVVKRHKFMMSHICQDWRWQPAVWVLTSGGGGMTWNG